ncbi:hypothetical protein KI387_038391, partial [Taxus chinensis]
IWLEIWMVGGALTGYIFIVGGMIVSWISRLQKVLALSTTEPKYVAALEASKEMIWM